MPTVNPVLPNDGEDADAIDITGPIQAILSVLNGNIDADNIKPGSLAWSLFGSVSNAIPSTAMQDSGNLEQFRDDANISFIVSGIIWSTLTGLNAAMTSGIYYSPTGIRNAPAAVSSYTFSASKDTYIDFGPNGGSPSYTPVANGADAPALTANYIRVALVVTNGTGITTIRQNGYDSKNNKIYPTGILTGAQLPGVWWEELGRVKNDVAATSLSITNLPLRKYLLVRQTTVGNGATTTNEFIRFNNDSSALYDYRRAIAGAPQALVAADTSINVYGDLSAQSVGEYSITNTASLNKTLMGRRQVAYLVAGGNGATWVDLSAVWRNSTVPINRIDYMTSTGQFAAGGELIVLGHD
jgi:hypothetical protein